MQINFSVEVSDGETRSLPLVSATATITWQPSMDKSIFVETLGNRRLGNPDGTQVVEGSFAKAGSQTVVLGPINQ